MWSRLRHDGRFAAAAVVLSVLAAMAVVPGWFTWTGLFDCDLGRSREPPSLTHWFGFDVLGCDLWTQTVYGTRTSLVIGVLGTLGAAVIGGVGGLLAGYLDDPVDAAVSRVTDAWLALPAVLGAALTVALTEQRGLGNVTIVLALFGWPVLLRVLRSAVRAQRSADYVTAARALGAGPWRIMRRHVLPNALAPFVAYLPVAFATIVAGEAALSYLGIGLQLPATSWGLLLAEPADRYLATWHLTVLPALFLAAALGALLVLADALGDAVAGRGDR